MPFIPNREAALPLIFSALNVDDYMHDVGDNFSGVFLAKIPWKDRGWSSEPHVRIFCSR
jgi:hypothetical protein